MTHLTETLAYYLEQARKANDEAETQHLQRLVHRLFEDSQAPEDSPEQEDDCLLGWLRMRQLEFAEAERRLIDDRPAGVALIAHLVAEMGERFETAMAWEVKKEK